MLLLLASLSIITQCKFLHHNNIINKENGNNQNNELPNTLNRSSFTKGVPLDQILGEQTLPEEKVLYKTVFC